MTLTTEIKTGANMRSYVKHLIQSFEKMSLKNEIKIIQNFYFDLLIIMLPLLSVAPSNNRTPCARLV